MVIEPEEDFTELRAQATRAIVDSDADKKLIIAGPGTGKTFTFKAALERADDRGLALTFIRNLVIDLRRELDDVADVFTFHGFCKHQLHRHLTEGLRRDWHYYPPLLGFVAHDLSLIGSLHTAASIEHALHTLDDSEHAISESLRLGNYYNAVSHCDVVYRILRHFEERDDDVPTYRLIVVDEYQDFSLMETALIDVLAAQNDVLIAGDDDQALYGFKHAEARFIRELAQDGNYECFPLPYCSRCTDVIVVAVNDVLRTAVDNGNLAGRLEKDFQCYVPDKARDSEAHPEIIHAACSVQQRRAPYLGRYIVEQIKAISADDIAESHEKRYPTVLVAGPNPFLDAAFDVIMEAFPRAERRKAPELEIDPLDGYRYLAKDEDSRLGWRILLHCDEPEDVEDILVPVARDEAEVADLLEPDYRDYHLDIADLVGRVAANETLDAHEVDRLLSATGRPSLNELRAALGLAEEKESEDVDAPEMPVAENAAIGERHEDEPTIIATTLTGSKGLSAGHVFIVGFNDSHFPRDPAAITDKEVCEFVVGLSRTRKACHLVSVGNHAGKWLRPSAFQRWIARHLRHVKVDKAYFDG